MFNIHSTELLLVCIVALLVIGPDKLPAAIKTASLWIGRFRRSFYKVKAEIERELNTDEIKRQLHNESVLAEIDEAKSQIKHIGEDAENSINKIVSSENFDPGASKKSYDEDGNELEEKSLKSEIEDEIQDLAEEVEDVKKGLYGMGSNPKLADNEKSAESGETKEDGIS